MAAASLTPLAPLALSEVEGSGAEGSPPRRAEGRRHPPWRVPASFIADLAVEAALFTPSEAEGRRHIPLYAAIPVAGPQGGTAASESALRARFTTRVAWPIFSDCSVLSSCTTASTGFQPV